MVKIIVKKSNLFKGSVKIDGVKNVVLLIIVVILLVNGKLILNGVLNLRDVYVILDLLRYVGVEVEYKENIFIVDVSNIKICEVLYEFVRKMRVFFLVMGLLFVRFNSMKIFMLGGCVIGIRFIDLYLKGFKVLGVKIEMDYGFVEVVIEKLVGNKLYLDFLFVGVIENIMMVVFLVEGIIIIENVVEELEIVDLVNFLNEMGVDVKGVGINIIKIKGVKELKGVEYNVILDRIEVVIYMVVVVMIKGDIIVENVLMEYLKLVVVKLREVGCEIIEMDNFVRVVGLKVLKLIDIKILLYLGFFIDV